MRLSLYGCVSPAVATWEGPSGARSRAIAATEPGAGAVRLASWDPEDDVVARGVYENVEAYPAQPVLRWDAEVSLWLIECTPSPHQGRGVTDWWILAEQ